MNVDAVLGVKFCDRFWVFSKSHFALDFGHKIQFLGGLLKFFGLRKPFQGRSGMFGSLMFVQQVGW